MLAFSNSKRGLERAPELRVRNIDILVGWKQSLLIRGFVFLPHVRSAKGCCTSYESTSISNRNQEEQCKLTNSLVTETRHRVSNPSKLR